MKAIKVTSFLLIFLSFITSCCRVPSKIEPKVTYSIEESVLKELSSPFPPLSTDEKRQDWGKEYAIGLAFAKKLDLYRAITSLKRAEILILSSSLDRMNEIQYNILLCYYLGKKYPDVIDTFENSSLPSVDKKFCAFHDLLVILYESYKETGDCEKAKRIFEVIESTYPATKEQLLLSTALVNADFCFLEKFTHTPPKKNSIDQMLCTYNRDKKSIVRAQVYNGLLPGAGYLYLGLGRSAVTSFLLNGLFIAAAYQFFHKGYIAAGIITTSFELGWYFGGIYGAGEEAKFYNEQKYQKLASSLMNEKGYFPIFMLKWGF